MKDRTLTKIYRSWSESFIHWSPSLHNLPTAFTRIYHERPGFTRGWGVFWCVVPFEGSENNCQGSENDASVYRRFTRKRSKAIFVDHSTTMKSASSVIIVLAACILSLGLRPVASIYLTNSGWVHFTSDAPLELIEAENSRVGVVVDTEKRTVAMKVPVIGFDGFNSELQKEHFYENYMESEMYPKGTFTGKIIEDVDLSKPGTYKIRAKGMLNIHGVEKERIIPGAITVGSGKLSIRSNFEVPLEDHDITIPKIVNQKIAEVIIVEVKAELKPKN